MTTTTTQPTPAPKPDAQPVQAATHTPGPWLANVDTVWRGGEPIVCHPINSARSIADARLIAAAPALLAALENAANVLAALATGQLAKVERNSPALLQAREALQLARGGAK